MARARAIALKAIIISAFLLGTACFFSGPLVISALSRAIDKNLSGSRTRIRSCVLWPPGHCRITGIEIRRNKAYRVSIPALNARFGFSFTDRLPYCDLSLKGPAVDLDLPGIPSADILRTGDRGSGKGFAVRKLNADGLTVAIKTADASIDAHGAFTLDLRSGLVDRMDLDSRSFEFRQIKGAGARLSLVQGGRGDLHIEKLSAGKLNARNIKARLFLSGRQVDLQDASFDLFEGIVSASGRLNLKQGLAYEASIKASGLDMALFIKDFDLEKKIELSGNARGTLNVRGSLQGIESVFADIKTADPGGVFNITDESIIDGLAERSGQAEDIIRSSFTDYHYASAQSHLTTEGRKVVLDTVFEGETGKRSLKVVLHDFAIQGGGK